MHVKYDCHIMHPLKDQREGVKYGRGVNYGVTKVVSGDILCSLWADHNKCIILLLSQYCIVTN